MDTILRTPSKRKNKKADFSKKYEVEEETVKVEFVRNGVKHTRTTKLSELPHILKKHKDLNPRVV